MDGSIKCTSYNFCTLCVIFDVGLCGMNGECVAANSIKMAKNGREEKIEIYVACINFIWKRSLYVSWDLEKCDSKKDHNKIRCVVRGQWFTN